jgi:hypothetical protein
MKVIEKLVITLIFAVSLLPMQLSWFGVFRGVDEVQGTIVLFYPVTILCILAFLISIWINFKNKTSLKYVSQISLLGIVGVEIYKFLTWDRYIFIGHFDLAQDFRQVYPEFYFGISVSLVTLVLYIIYINRFSIDARAARKAVNLNADKVLG